MKNYFIYVALFLLLADLSAGPTLPPPSVFLEMQKNAPEHLDIEVLRVQTEPGTNLDEELFCVTAVAVKVHRSASGIQPGDFLQIKYVIRCGLDGKSLAGEPPRLKQGEKVPAFLKSREGRISFEPAAGAMSFATF